MPEIVPRELLEALAAEASTAEPTPQGKSRRTAPVQRESNPAHPVDGELDLSVAERRATAYLWTLDDSVAGQHGHDKLYRAACVLAHGFGLSYDQALPILRRWNQEKAHPPESEPQLHHKLTDALKLTGNRGHLLNKKGSSELSFRVFRECSTRIYV
jgi:hypothetical protein